MPFPIERLRRLRRTEALRGLVRETDVLPRHLVQPLFVEEGTGVRRAIDSLPGQERLSPDTAADEAEALAGLGVRAVLLFGIPSAKDARGSSAWDEEGPVASAASAIKARVPSMLVAADVCLCEYTSHGHCGIVEPGAAGPSNDASLPLHARAAVAYARAGADIVAPSGMLDGCVVAIRKALDGDGRSDVAILAYAVKYASAFYGPFRAAAGSTPADGDRRGHQMDSGNLREALREAAADDAEGADLLMVKPAGPCLDVIAAVRARTTKPVAAYQVSGEYAMIRVAAERGLIDGRAAMWESVRAIRRAGADIVVTYFAKELAAEHRALGTT